MRDCCSAIIASHRSLSLGREPLHIHLASRLRIYGASRVSFVPHGEIFLFFFQRFFSPTSVRCRTPRCVNGTRSRARKGGRDRPSCVHAYVVPGHSIIRIEVLPVPIVDLPSILSFCPFWYANSKIRGHQR